MAGESESRSAWISSEMPKMERSGGRAPVLSTGSSTTKQ